jgi:hypothetical protein
MPKTIWPALEAALATLPRSILERIAADTGAEIPADPRLAATLLTRARHHPTHVLDDLTEAEWHLFAAEVGVAGRADWERANPQDASLPEYRQDCWEDAITDAVWPGEPPPAGPRAGTERDPSHASAWPELTSVEAWAALADADRAGVVDALAAGLGADFQRRGTTLHHISGVDLVPVPGGAFELGLGRAEARELKKVVGAGGPEAQAMAKDYPRQVRPVRSVTLPPFLCGSAPASRAQVAAVLGAPVDPGDLDDANPHRVALISARLAAYLRSDTLRLLSEAEWEWVARAGGTRAWLCGEVEADAWIERIAASRLQLDGHPWGVHGMAWGTWVEDGWSSTHGKTPLDGAPRRPTEVPTTTRGGGLEAWPWQDTGEILALHATFRDRGGTYHPLLWGSDLPPRAG